MIGMGALLATPVLVWLALPGRFSFPLLLAVCLVPFLHRIQTLGSVWKAWRCGLAVGAVMHVLQLYWIVSVLRQYGGLEWYLATPAMLLLCVYMGLYPAVFAAGFHYLVRSPQAIVPVLGGSALWVGLDWLRSWLFGGFPWMDVGYGLWSYPWLLQGVDLVGHYGLTFIIVMLNIVLLTSLQRTRPVMQRVIGASVCVVIIGSWLSYSAVRGQQVDDLIVSADTAALGIVQGNVEQTRKWSPEERLRTVKDYVRLSDDLLESGPASLVVWPETALPFYPRRDELLQPLIDMVWEKHVSVLSGAPWYEVEEDRTKRLVRYYNGAMLMDPSTSFVVGYYKSHLVPFGEYVPLKKYLPFIAPLVEAAGDFTAGRIDRTLDAGVIRSGVLICYESIFGEIGRAWVKAGANLLINLTNDAWYGKSSAPHQSWAMTVYRAVETRRSLLRSANTGISGYIDPTGAIGIESELFEQWAATVTVPLLDVQTIFVGGGYLFAPLNGMLALLLVFVTAAGTGRRRDNLGEPE
jgi:apolipoprotein N-acyltransferase